MVKVGNTVPELPFIYYCLCLIFPSLFSQDRHAFIGFDCRLTSLPLSREASIKRVSLCLNFDLIVSRKMTSYALRSVISLSSSATSKKIKWLEKSFSSALSATLKPYDFRAGFYNLHTVFEMVLGKN